MRPHREPGGQPAGEADRACRAHRRRPGAPGRPPARQAGAGYGDAQVADLSETIERIDCDLIVSATPIDITRVLKTRRPILRVGYELEEIGSPNLKEILKGL